MHRIQIYYHCPILKFSTYSQISVTLCARPLLRKMFSLHMITGKFVGSLKREWSQQSDSIHIIWLAASLTWVRRFGLASPCLFILRGSNKELYPTSSFCDDVGRTVVIAEYTHTHREGEVRECCANTFSCWIRLMSERTTCYSWTDSWACPPWALYGIAGRRRGGTVKRSLYRSLPPPAFHWFEHNVDST